MDEIIKYLHKSRQKLNRIRTMYLHLRKLEKYESWSDIVLLNSVVNGLRRLGEDYSKQEIYSAFKEIDKNDYDKGDKNKLLKCLLKNAKDKSIF